MPVRVFPPLQVTLSTDTTTAQYLLLDTHAPVDGSAILDVTLLLRNVTGNFTAKPGTMLFDVRSDNPDAPAAISDGSFTGAAGFTHFHETSLGTGAKAGLVPGIAYKLSTGSTLGTAQATLLAALYTNIEVLGTQEVAVHPGMMASTDVNYAALADWLPAVGFDAFKAWFVVTENLSDYLEYQLVMRTADDPRTPNAWQTAETGYTNPSSTNTERNTGQLSAPAGANITSHMFFQPGIAFRKKSGAGGNPRALIQATTAIVRS